MVQPTSTSPGLAPSSPRFVPTPTLSPTLSARLRAPPPPLGAALCSDSSCPYHEHVCVRPRRASTISTVSLPVAIRRRESAASAAGARVPGGGAVLDTVPSGASSDEDQAARGHVANESASGPAGVGASDAEADAHKPHGDDTRLSTSVSAASTFAYADPPAKERLATASSTSSPTVACAPLAPGDVEKGGLPGCRSGSLEVDWNWARWGAETVATPALVPALIAQALATGVLDATTYADFHTFASNQTGNAILLTLSAVGTAVGTPSAQLLLTGVSFGGFLGGAFAFGHFGHWIGVRRRAWLLLSTLLQTLMLVVSAILLSPAGPRTTSLGAKHEWAIIFLFATMSGAQVAMARQSSCQELPTAPMTSTFVDFVADPFLFAGVRDPRTTPRNRRIAYVVAMLGGSFAGAAMHKYTTSWVVVVVAISIKLVALVLLGVAAPEEV